ncbi:UDP-N-acetylmuramoyl-tripeptide--D-alanyl-D-alanine ligase [Bifidobacterium sp. B4001]|uniref:UDP-N-acetylmuramoyl-tripeptide--D-alanyl-D- alanine ligase n=1 Tax=unclassified Bifidobacterium TaxID=2608897 RepID=UPI00226B3F13|nr:MULTISPECIES: UDP-N-acetylmuramoyl-tripeptide--D-alanyl-D-alanine ligase [unclassified Bifidobacterium]MCX8672596.1 UDP-N-acetylmuramoyl-tripeptide--D-alanyl-D-alanine ligase [Bifidobacterium sp. B4079]MCX8681029.1 UDP-N-acetylmuramoyl-tripeptide--D-alanyl-D-alanine ligase [Bifidobacterium sp. B4001]
MSQSVGAGSMPMTLEEVVEYVHGRLVEAGPGRESDRRSVRMRVVTDSRQAGADGLFVAIKGEHADGHDYVPGLGAKGCRAALIDHLVPGADLPQILVDDTVAALGLLARANTDLRRKAPGPFTVIGITGSVGKTTTKDLLASLLTQLGPVVAPVGSFNNEIGLPLTALEVGPDTRYLVAEMGASHVGEIANLTRMVPPDVALVLKVGVAHLGEFGSVERIAQAKSEIVQGLVPGGTAVLNADDSRVAAMADLAPGPVLRFGMADQGGGRDRDLDGSARYLDSDGLDRPAFELCLRGQQPVRLRLGIPGRHNVMNALAAATAAHALGLDAGRIADELGRQRRISPHRMALSSVRLPDASFTLIDDSFNANPDSVRAGLDALAAWRGSDGPIYRIAVLGVMLELGAQGEQLHQEIGAYCRRQGIDALVAVGCRDRQMDSLAQALVRGAGGPSDPSEDQPESMRVLFAQDADQADQMVRRLCAKHWGQQNLVLLKGSHMSGLSDLADRWQG